MVWQVNEKEIKSEKESDHIIKNHLKRQMEIWTEDQWGQNEVFYHLSWRIFNNYRVHKLKCSCLWGAAASSLDTVDPPMSRCIGVVSSLFLIPCTATRLIDSLSLMPFLTLLIQCNHDFSFNTSSLFPLFKVVHLQP